MPRGNKMGPRGLGPRTGRALGYCSGHDGAGYMSSSRSGWGRMSGLYQGGFALGHRAAWGRGGGGFQCRWNDFEKTPVMTQQEQKNLLKNQIEQYESEIAQLKRQMERLSESQSQDLEE